MLAYGQVYNPTAITYVPGKTAEWYLAQAGGPTETGPEESGLRDPGQRLCRLVAGQRLVQGRRAQHEVASRRYPGCSGEGLRRVDRLEDYAGDSAVDCLPGGCRGCCCSLLNAFQTPIRLQPGEVFFCAAAYLSGFAGAQAPTPSLLPRRHPPPMRSLYFTWTFGLCRRTSCRTKSAFLTTPAPHESGEPVLHRPGNLRQRGPGRKRHRNRGSLTQKLHHHQPGGDRLQAAAWPRC